MSAYLSVNEICCGYGADFNLKGISFNLPRGSFGGIIGPNGSGKTTLFKGISGELELTSGTVMLDGQQLDKMPLKQKAGKLAIVPQFCEFGDFTVEEFVLLGRLPYRQRFQFFENKEDWAIAEKYMELTDVLKSRHKYMSALSGGEQQLASIARALCQEPKLLLLDEPTSHLDITHQVQVLNLVQRLNAELGLTVLMIIHDLNLAGEYCDYLVMMKQGTLHQKGTPAEVLTYANIEEVYNTVVITQMNPLSKKPAVFLVSEKIIKARENNC